MDPQDVTDYLHGPLGWPRLVQRCPHCASRIAVVRGQDRVECICCGARLNGVPLPREAIDQAGS
jgi:hypothetical protein